MVQEFKKHFFLGLPKHRSALGTTCPQVSFQIPILAACTQTRAPETHLDSWSCLCAGFLLLRYYFMQQCPCLSPYSELVLFHADPLTETWSINVLQKFEAMIGVTLLGFIFLGSQSVSVCVSGPGENTFIHFVLTLVICLRRKVAQQKSQISLFGGFMTPFPHPSLSLFPFLSFELISHPSFFRSRVFLELSLLSFSHWLPSYSSLSGSY